MEAGQLAPVTDRAFEVALRIRHPSLDPAEISRELKLEADHTFRAGEPRRSASGLAPAAVHAESYWFGTLNPALWPSDAAFTGQPASDRPRRNTGATAADGLDLALPACCNRFLGRHAAFLKRLRAEGGQVALLVSLTARVRAFSITPELGRSLSQLGIRLEFELAGEGD